MATELVQNRTLALQVGYVATDWTHRPSLKDYDEALTDWEVRLMVRDGKPIGAAYTKGPEFHVSILPEWRGRWCTRGVLKELIADPVSVTRVTPGFEHVGGFLERLGFEAKGDGVFVRTCDHGN